jgi:hypothetical protein
MGDASIPEFKQMSGLVKEVISIIFDSDYRPRKTPKHRFRHSYVHLSSLLMKVPCS